MDNKFLRVFVKRVILAILLFFAVIQSAANAADFYVTPTRAKRVPKLDRRKCRDLSAVLRRAEPGDVVHLTAGTYVMPRKGFTVSNPITILGGYSSDFKVRDVRAYPTVIEATGGVTSHEARALFSIFDLDFLSYSNRVSRARLIVDGLCFDGAAFTNFAGRISNHFESKDLAKPKADEGTPFYTTLLAGENLEAPIDCTIRNCLFKNSYGAAILLRWGAGSFVITNNTFTNNFMFAINVSGQLEGAKTPCEIRANTIYFSAPSAMGLGAEPFSPICINWGIEGLCTSNFITQVECTDEMPPFEQELDSDVDEAPEEGTEE